MDKISSGIRDLDVLIDSLHIGDNVVWEVEAGTSYPLFVQNFFRQAFSDDKNVIYISFNKSPSSILQQIGKIPHIENFILLDCFTSGKGKNDRAFTKFYENNYGMKSIKVDNPGDIEYFTSVLNDIEDTDKGSIGKRYIFDSLTGMQDLWGNEDSTYKFFTYMCPRLYDLGTVAYWILEKDAHSQSFKANLRHITQVVLDLYKRKDKLHIKALKLEGRQSREAFKPHPYVMNREEISIIPVKKEPLSNIGTKIKALRMKTGMSQKELADKIDLTPSFISQLESNQISPSLHSFIHICNTLGASPAQILEGKEPDEPHWLFRKESVLSHRSFGENDLKGYSIVRNGRMSGTLVVLEPDAHIEEHFIPQEGKKLIHVLKGNISIIVGNTEKTLNSGDSLFLKEEVPSVWKNRGGDKAELLLVCA
jgi:transcriptional regulator with XRE-family HTH domain